MRHRRRSAAEWSRLVAEQEALGMSAPEFASARGLSLGTLRWWRWRLRQQARETGRLLEVRLFGDVGVGAEEEAEWGEAQEQERVHLSLPGGVELELQDVPSPHWLAALCEALETPRLSGLR